MQPRLLYILNALDIQTSVCKNLRQQIAGLQNNDDVSKLITTIQDIERDVSDHSFDTSAESRPFFNIFLAYLYSSINDHEKAVSHAEHALENFYVFERNASFNSSLSQWFLGILLLIGGHASQAVHEMRQAREKLMIVKELYEIKEYDNRKRCELNIIHLENDIEQHQSEEYHSAQTNTEYNDSRDNIPYAGLIAVPWLPIRETVQAGKNGPEWSEPIRSKYSHLQTVILDDHSFGIHPIRTAGNVIRLKNNQRYGWAPVTGRSMNAARPITIEQGDYVLFEDIQGPASPTLQNSDIVIVARIIDGQYSYMVKRYEMSSNMIVSETDQSGPEYDPFPLNTNNPIIAIVIAIAKPIK